MSAASGEARADAPVLDVSGLCVEFRTRGGTVRALDGVGLRIAAGAQRVLDVVVERHVEAPLADDLEERRDGPVAVTGCLGTLIAVAQRDVEFDVTRQVALRARAQQFETAPAVLIDRGREVLVGEDRPDLLARDLAALGVGTLWATRGLRAGSRPARSALTAVGLVLAVAGLVQLTFLGVGGVYFVAFAVGALLLHLPAARAYFAR